MTPEERNRQFEIRQQIAALQEELNPLEVKERQEKNASVVGRYFKYHNSYGSGEDWWKYLKIVSEGEYWPIGIAFQHTSRDSVEIETDKTVTSIGGWEEISQAEYENAWQGLMKQIAKYAATAGIQGGANV